MDESRIYSYDDYHAYLEAAIELGRFGSRGPRSKLAEAAGCQVAYVSQVLGGHAHFSLEQSNGIANYLQLDDEERSYFFEMILYARAGTQEIKQFYHRRLKKIQKAQIEISKRLNGIRKVADEYHATYYGAWYYTAIHMLVHIPEFQTVSNLARRLSLEASIIQSALQKLVAAEILQEQDGRYTPMKNANLHLERGSPNLPKHLSNWRLRAMLAIDNAQPDSLHYSSVMSLHPEDVTAITEVLVKAIERTRQITSSSENETSIFSINMDFFEV